MSARANKTTISFGTKLRVISLIDVAAWIIPMVKPIANAIARTGPPVAIIVQKANDKSYMFVFGSMR